MFSLGRLFRPPLSSVNEKKKSEQDKHVTICAQKEQRFLSIVHRTGSRKRSSRRMAGEGEGGGGNTFACISTSLNSFDFSWYIIAFSLSFVVLFICIF